MINTIGYITSVSILAGYWYANKNDKWHMFNWVNAIGSMILVPLNLIAGAGFAALLSLGFGAVGWYNIWRNHYPKMTYTESNGYFGPDEGNG